MRFKVLSVGASVYISVEPCNHHLRHIPLAFAHRFQTEVMMFRRVGFNRKKATGSVMRRLLLARTTETTSKTMAAMGSDMWPFSCPSILTRAYTAARSGGDDNTELRNGTREADPNQQPDRPRRDTAAGQAAGAAPADLPGLLLLSWTRAWVDQVSGTFGRRHVGFLGVAVRAAALSTGGLIRFGGLGFKSWVFRVTLNPKP